MRVVGSLATPGVFEWRNASTRDATLEKVTGLIRDNGGTEPAKFGGLIALTNGVLIRIVDGSDVTVSEFGPFHNNAEFFSLSASSVPVLMLTGSVFVPIPWAPGDRGLTFPPAYALQWLVQDDLSELDEFDVYVQGSIEGAGTFGTASR
jgi:hypothetical protein